MTRVIPAALDAERAILGGLIGDADDPQIMADAAARLRGDGGDFRHGPHAALWRLLYSRWADRKPNDLVSLATALQGADGVVGGMPYVLGLPAHCPSTANLGHYLDDVLEAAARRRAIEAIEPAMAGLYDRAPVAETTDRLVVALLEAGRRRDNDDWQWLGDLSTQVLTAHDDAQASGKPPGLMLGLGPLDRHLGGINPTDLVVIAGRPGMGKTALAVNGGLHVAETSGPVAMFSLEMPGTQLAGRILAQRARTSAKLIRTGELPEAARDRVVEAVKRSAKVPFAVIARPMGVGEIIAKARTLALRCTAKKTPLRAIVVDYLQLVAGDKKAGNREQEVAGVTGALKNLALDLGVPVLLVSQLNRGPEDRKSHEPEMRDLRESGAIEQDADIILFPVRPGYYAPENAALAEKAVIIIAKGRHSGPGRVDVGWSGERTEFYDLAERRALQLAPR